MATTGTEEYKPIECYEDGRTIEIERKRNDGDREREGIPLSTIFPVQSYSSSEDIVASGCERVSRKKPRYWWATGVLIFWYDTATTRWSHRSSSGSAPPYLFPSGRAGRDCGKRIFQGLLPLADSSPFHVSNRSVDECTPVETLFIPISRVDGVPCGLAALRRESCVLRRSCLRLCLFEGRL